MNDFHTCNCFAENYGVKKKPSCEGFEIIC